LILTKYLDEKLPEHLTSFGRREETRQVAVSADSNKTCNLRIT